VSEFCHGLLASGTKRGWLIMLTRGWAFADEFIVEPMAGHHGHFAVLMKRRDSITSVIRKSVALSVTLIDGYYRCW
jgi:hypothetical protein